MDQLLVWYTMILLPIPFSFVTDIDDDLVVNFVNNFGIASGTMPVPLSLTLTTISLFFSLSFTCSWIEIEIVLFSLVNLRHYLAGLLGPWTIHPISASTKTSVELSHPFSIS